MSSLPAGLGAPSTPTAASVQRAVIAGFFNKVEPRALGVASRRRFWFALSDESPYLYWFRDKTDVSCVGRIPLSGASFTYDPRDTGRFEIRIDGGEVHIFEASSQRQRTEWLKAMQDVRKRHYQAFTPSPLVVANQELAALHSHAATPRTLDMGQSGVRSPEGKKTAPINIAAASSSRRTEEKDGSEGDEASDTPIPMPRRMHKEPVPNTVEGEVPNELLGLLGPRTSAASTDAQEPATPNLRDPLQLLKSASPPLAQSAPTSTFYLDTDGALNEFSLEMPPKEMGLRTEALLVKTQQKMEPARRALEKARASLQALRASKAYPAHSASNASPDRPRINCEDCKKWVVAFEELEDHTRDVEEHNETREQMLQVMRNALLAAERRVDALKKMETFTTNQEEIDFILEKEDTLTRLQLELTARNRECQELRDSNRTLETRVGELEANVEAFRESVRTKEELIMRLYDEELKDSKERRTSGTSSEVAGIGVPEGIPLDLAQGSVADDAARKVFEEESVRDVNELKDLVEGYRSQNVFLNKEILELQYIIKALEERERTLSRKAFDREAHYYKLKSRYLMLLNHFKTPNKPGKIMEPGVLRELLVEATDGTMEPLTPRGTMGRRQDGTGPEATTDALGFYLGKRDGDNDSADLLKQAADCERHYTDITAAATLEQSEEYMNWLQRWDAFLVNCVHKQLPQGSNELKNLVRSGVPDAYRSRVWKALVSFSVSTFQQELGFGYFECMLKKADSRKEGPYDAAIKQIDLDLARTLPTNKHFEDAESGMLDSLRRVLYAFRYHNSEVGYCQGLNRLAAIALLYLDEQNAFWFLVACVEKLQPPYYYASTLIGAVADQRVLRDLVAEKLPRLAVHLRSLEVDLSLFTLSWFLTVFVDVLPHSIYLQIFDVFLNEGNKVLFRFALAVLKMSESAVLQCKTIGTVHACLSRAAEHVGDYKALSQVAFFDLNPFPLKAIETKRQQYLKELGDPGIR